MPPKRKASTATGGRGSKRVASGEMTPVSNLDDSSDEYTEGGEEASEGEAEDLKSALLVL